MTMTLRPRLAAVLGMMGSDHDGEVLAAARQAERIRREAGWTWPELLSGTVKAGPQPMDWRRAVAVCRARADRLTQWENEFVETIAAYRSDPSERQREILTRLAAKAAPEA